MTLQLVVSFMIIIYVHHVFIVHAIGRGGGGTLYPLLKVIKRGHYETGYITSLLLSQKLILFLVATKLLYTSDTSFSLTSPTTMTLSITHTERKNIKHKETQHDIQHNGIVMLSVVMLNVIFPSVLASYFAIPNMIFCIIWFSRNERF